MTNHIPHHTLPQHIVFDWVAALSGSFIDSENWLVDTDPVMDAPSADDIAQFFAIGEPYTVSGGGAVAEIVIYGGDLTLTGDYVLGGIDDNDTLTALKINAGSLTLLSYGTITADDAAILVGTVEAATVTVEYGSTLAGGSMEIGAGSQLINNGSVDLGVGGLLLNGEGATLVQGGGSFLDADANNFIGDVTLTGGASIVAKGFSYFSTEIDDDFRELGSGLIDYSQ